MTVQLSRVLKNLNLFIDGVGYAGRVDELTLPTLTIKVEEHRAGGMDAPVSIDMGMEAMEAQFMISDHDPDLFTFFGRLDIEGVQVIARGATQAQGSADVTPVVVTMNGIWTAIDPGSWKPGDKNVISVTARPIYYKLEIGDQTQIEIDVTNMTRIIGGEDQLAAQREAIGL
jgi:P2 family phage contractile tail tube protein